MSNKQSTSDQGAYIAPYLTQQDLAGVFSFTMVLMMLSTRVSLTNLALTQSRNLLKLLLVYDNSLKVTPENVNNKRMAKEILSLSDTLAATLHSKRHYITKNNDNRGEIEYTVEPRYLLFEFCHGLLLRQSQVELVHKLTGRMQAGQSICTQMIMVSSQAIYSGASHPIFHS